MVSNVTAKKPLFPVSFEIFRANVNHTNQEIISKIETSRKIILNFAVSSRSSKLVIWQTHIFFEILSTDDGKTGLLQITARQSSFTQQRTAIPNLK